MTRPKEVRVALIQPALPGYRIPVFEALSKRPGVDLTVFYGDMKDLTNGSGGTFKRELVDEWWFAGDRLLFSPVQVKAALSSSFDVVVFPWSSRSLTLVPGLLFARMHSLGTVVWGHGFSKQDSPVRRWLRNGIARLAGSVLFYAKPAAQRFAQETGLSESVFVAPNTIDTTPIDEAITAWGSREAERIALVRGVFGGADAERRPLLLHVSRLLAENGLDQLLESLGSLDGVNVAIIGKGPERRNLERLVAKRRVEDRVVFLGAIYDEMGLAPWFLSATAFVYPGNIGLSCNHALAYGVPVVTSDDLGSANPEIVCIEPNRNGLLYEAGNPDSLVSTIRCLASGESALDSAARIRGQFRTEFGLEQMVDGLQAAILHAATVA